MKIPQKTREAVIVRDLGCCRRCGIPIWQSETHSVHHRKPRGMGGTKDPRCNDPRNLVTLCGDGTRGCHGWVESYRDLARTYGWLIRSYDDLDAPMLSLDGTWTYLYPDGSAVESLTAKSALLAMGGE